MILETGGNSFRDIEFVANRTLARDAEGIDYIAQVQCGISLVDLQSELPPSSEASITTLSGITQLSKRLRQKHLTTFPQEARTQRMSEVLYNNIPDMFDEFAHIQARLTILEDCLGSVHQEGSELLLQQTQSWQSTIEYVTQALALNEDQKISFATHVQEETYHLRTNPRGRSKRTFQDKLTHLLQRPDAVAKMIDVTRSEKGAVLAEAVAQDFLETALINNAEKVLTVVEQPLSLKAKTNKLLRCLWGYETDPVYVALMQRSDVQKYFHAFDTAQDRLFEEKLRPVGERNDLLYANRHMFNTLVYPIIAEHFHEQGDNDEIIDLLDVREQVHELQEEAQKIQDSSLPYERKQIRLEILDEQLVMLLTPIVNKVARAFPHESSADPTYHANLTTILRDRIAICAGKSNILHVVTHFLGLTARENSVNQVMDGRRIGHTYLEVNLFSDRQLVLDANFEKDPSDGILDEEQLTMRIRRMEPTMPPAEVITKRKRIQEYHIPNAEWIPKDAHVHIYTIQKVKPNEQPNKYEAGKWYFTRLNPYTGEKETWKANIPYPHREVEAEVTRKTSESQGYYYNNVRFDELSADIKKYCYRQALILLPYDRTTYEDYAVLLGNAEKIMFLEEVRSRNPKVFWDTFYQQLVSLYYEYGEIDKLGELYNGLKSRRPNQYYANISYMLSLVIPVAYTETSGEEQDQQTRDILEKAMQDNPGLFFTYKTNVSLLFDHYQEPRQQIALLENFQQHNQTEFWEHLEYDGDPVYMILASLYMQLGRIDDAIALMEEGRGIYNDFLNKPDQSAFLARLYATRDNTEE